MRLAQLSLWLVIAAATCLPALAEPARSGFGAGWDDFAITPTRDDFARKVPVAVPAARKPEPDRSLDFQLYGNKVDFGTIEGAAGARITPKSSPLTVGVAVGPRNADLSQSIPLSLNAYDDVGGALELKLREGPFTPSMTVTGPIPDGESGSAVKSDQFRTMFGLGYSF